MKHVYGIECDDIVERFTESERREMVAMDAQKPRHYPEDYFDPDPWQQNAIRIMEDCRE